jgi:phosphoadenosine phosphosulfate reductase
VEKRGMPSRFARFCCGELKEYKIYDRAIQGIRRSESTKRAERYKEPEYCRTYSHKEKVRVYLPILEWTDEDVERFISDRQIKCAPVYYDADGTFHVERRLGCIGCPMATEWKRREQLAQYPLLLKAMMKAQKRHGDLHPGSKFHKWFDGNVYDKFYADLFYHSRREWLSDNEGLIFPRDSKAILEKYFNIDLTI